MHNLFYFSEGKGKKNFDSSKSLPNFFFHNQRTCRLGLQTYNPFRYSQTFIPTFSSLFGNLLINNPLFYPLVPLYPCVCFGPRISPCIKPLFTSPFFLLFLPPLYPTLVYFLLISPPPYLLSFEWHFLRLLPTYSDSMNAVTELPFCLNLVLCISHTRVLNCAPAHPTPFEKQPHSEHGPHTAH